MRHFLELFICVINGAFLKVAVSPSRPMIRRIKPLPLAVVLPGSEAKQPTQKNIFSRLIATKYTFNQMRHWRGCRKQKSTIQNAAATLNE